MRFVSLAFAALGGLTAACVTDRASFRPTENVYATGHAGQPAAVYNLRARPGQASQIEVQVWSSGAYEAENRTYTRLSLEVKNTSAQPIWLDADRLQLAAFDHRGRRLPPPQLVRITSPSARGTRVNPGAAATLRLLYALPDEVDPDAINAMRLRWAIARADGSRYVQFTGFRRIPEPTYAYGTGWYYDPIYGYYDPFFYGPPYRFHDHYSAPVRRVIVVDRDRPRLDRDRPQIRVERRERRSTR